MRRADCMLEGRTPALFHSTSLQGLLSVLRTGVLKPKDYESFVSVSSIPIVSSDISGTDVLIALPRSKFGKLFHEVSYTPDWASDHPDEASYIAGEGWREQFSLDDWIDMGDPDVVDPETGDVDMDAEEQAWKDAEYQAFEDKSEEREWISKKQGEPLRVDPADILVVLVRDPSKVQTIRDHVSRVSPDVSVEALSKKPFSKF